MTEEKKEAPKKSTRRPQALKRDIQGARKNQVNRAFKSRTQTTLRSLHAALTGGQPEAAKENLKALYSLMDKGVKKGIFKPNKTQRVKSRLAKKLVAPKA